MKILFLGNFSAEYSSENYYKKTIEEMGHSVIAIQEGGRSQAAQIKEYLILDSPDFFFWVYTHGNPSDGMLDVLSELRSRGIVSFAYHLDLYLGIKRQIEIQRDPFFRVDHFFTVDKLMADWMNEGGNSHLAKGHFLPAGIYEGECFIGTPSKERYPFDIVFTGAKGYHPEHPYRPQLIDWLRDTYGERFGHYGGGGMPTVRGPELNNLYASAKVVIGDTLCKGFDYPEYLSDRAFEVPGRGGFMIFPYIKGIENHYEIGKEIIEYKFNDFNDLKNKIDYYLINDDERETVRMAGFNRVKKDHTYRIRLSRILETIS